MWKVKEVWERTKEIYMSEPEMPAISESKLRQPSFRIMLKVLNALISKKKFAKGLFTTEELSYQSYNYIEEEVKFIERLILFLEKFTGKKLNIEPMNVIKIEGEEVHKILQTFTECARSNKSSDEVVKRIEKQQILKSKNKKKKLTIREILNKKKSFSNVFTRPTGNELPGKSLEKEIRKLEEEGVATNTEINAKNEEIEKLKLKYIEAVRELEEAKLTDLEHQSLDLEDQIKKLKEDIKDVTKKIAQKGEEAQQIIDQLKEKDVQEDPEIILRKEYEMLKATNKKLRDEYMSLENSTRVKESLNVERTKEMKEKDNKIQRLSKENGQLLVLIEEFKGKESNAGLKLEADKKVQEVESLSKEIEELKLELEALQSSSLLQSLDKEELKKSIPHEEPAKNNLIEDIPSVSQISEKHFEQSLENKFTSILERAQSEEIEDIAEENINTSKQISLKEEELKTSDKYEYKDDFESDIPESLSK